MFQSVGAELVCEKPQETRSLSYTEPLDLKLRVS